MDTPSFGLLDYAMPGGLSWEEAIGSPRMELRLSETASPPLDAETLRRCAWEISEQRPADAYVRRKITSAWPPSTPTQGFAHWRIRQQWVDETARQRGGAWHNCRLVLRLYDVSYIHFTGFNAHRLQDEALPGLCGQRFFHLSRRGTAQLGEVGFLLRSGEFIPAARSQAAQFGRDTWSPNRDPAALYVNERGRIEQVGNIREQENFLRERCRPKLRHPLRIAAFSLCCRRQTGLADSFLRELAFHESALGHEVHVFVPACGSQQRPPTWTGSTTIHCRSRPTARRWRRPSRSPASSEMRLQGCAGLRFPSSSRVDNRTGRVCDCAGREFCR